MTVPSPLEARVAQHFIDSADFLYQSASPLSPQLALAAEAIFNALTGGGKLLVSGHGDFNACAAYFSQRMVNGFERDRPALACVLLQQSGSEVALPNSLARQVESLGMPGDVFVVFYDERNLPQSKDVQISNNGYSAYSSAIATAFTRDLTVLAFTSQSPQAQRSDGESVHSIADLLRDVDVHLCALHERQARARELIFLMLHCLCDSVDLLLLGQEE